MDAETLTKLLDMYHLDFVLFGYDLTEMDDIILQKIKVKIIDMIKNQTRDKAKSNYAFFENTVVLSQFDRLLYGFLFLLRQFLEVMMRWNEQLSI